MSQAQPTTPGRGAYKWWVVFMLWFICFLNNADRQAINSIFPILHTLYGFDTFQLGLIGSAFMWVYAFGSPLAGYIGDRLRRKNLILGGCLFWSAVTMTTGACSKLWQFITVRALTGVGETYYFPASMSLISDYHGPRTRSKAMSFHQSSVYAGTILGTWLTAWFAEHYGWGVGFYLFGGMGVVLSVVLFAFLREPRRGQLDAPAAATAESADPGALTVPEIARAVFGTPSACLLMLAFLGANFVSTIFTTWTPTFLVEKFHYHLASAGLSGSVFIFSACAVGSPVGGILADRLTRRFRGGRMMVQGIGLLFGATFVFLIGSTSSQPTLILAMICFGFGKGLYDSNIFASIYEVVEPRARATAAGMINSIGWIGGALGPTAVGWLAKYGRGTEVQNMSWALSRTGIVYVAASALLFSVALVFVHRDTMRVGNDGRAEDPHPNPLPEYRARG